MDNKVASHPYHILPLSIWPILTASSLFFVAASIILWFHKYNFAHIIFGFSFIALIICLYSWWRDCINEGLYESHHTKEVSQGLRLGMALFITSEIMFFFAFFWSYFKARFYPENALQGVWATKITQWPPEGITTLDPWDVPFLNTLILLLSGTSVTWAHYEIEQGNSKEGAKAIGLTVLLGILFSCLQAYEYYHASFKLTDGVYGANFYLATGFHGFHVIVGTIFLAICYFRARRNDFTLSTNHLGFEFAAWYWHFIDVVWLFLFAFVYVFG